MMQNYCPSCYRSMPPEETTCRSCDPDRAARPSRALILFGLAGAAVLVTGVLTLNTRLCLAGAIISGAAVLLQIIRSWRSG